MLKRFVSILFLVPMLLLSRPLLPCVGIDDEPLEEVRAQTRTPFIPTTHAKEQTSEDLELLAKMKSLFFEAEKGIAARKEVNARAVDAYGAQNVEFKNDKGQKLAGLFFQRPNAPLTIIYVPGYFHDLTPPKEWCAPFAEMFPDYNIFSFDWRGFWESEGSNPFMRRNDFGANAYPDIQAALEFVKTKTNNKPVVLHGFCFGAAMCMHATIQAQKEGKVTADALGLCCLFTHFENLFYRVFEAEDRTFYRMLMHLGIGASVLDVMMNGSLFDLLPVEMIKEINKPCWFDHTTQDKFAIVDESSQVFEAAPGPKTFFQSDLGRHVRGHGKVPHQYRVAYNDFLRSCGLLKHEVSA